MNYFERAPSIAVSRVIKCYWVLENDSPVNSSQTVVPDGRSELIINLRRPFQSQNGDQWQSQPDCFFVGQITGPFLVRPNGPATVIGVRFQPHGASQLLGLPIDELTDSVVALDAISKRLHRRFERLRDLSSVSEQLAALDRILFRHMERIEDEDPLIAVAVGKFEQAGGLLGVGHLADRLGLSSRQFERRFRNAVGISPKLFCRMQRFQRVFQAMENPQSNWVDAAVHCGYYDQAHLIKDFREFSGATPTALLSEEFDLTRHFAQQRAMSHFSNTIPQSFL
jgi:AraC-like DNA-binding protein